MNAAHLLATHTRYPDLLGEDLVLGDPVFEKLGVFPEERRALLGKRDQVRNLVGG